MGLFYKKTVEHHDDGSYTERYDDHRSTSVTRNSDGSVREHGRDEHVFLSGDIRVTYDGDGNRINVQNKS